MSVLCVRCQKVAEDSAVKCPGCDEVLVDKITLLWPDRANTLNVITRALRELFPEQASDIIVELERRLPTGGRGDFEGLTNRDHTLWWRTRDGRWTHIHDMSTPHIKNTLELLRRGRKGHLHNAKAVRRWITLFEKELHWRTK